MAVRDKYRLTPAENIFLAKKVLVANVYSSARIEGINVTYPDTKTILDGLTVANMPTDDALKIINLRNAWAYILEAIEEPTSLRMLCEINARVSYNEGLAWGELRSGEVGIGGTEWRPPVPNREKASAELAEIVDGAASSSHTERAIRLWAWGMRTQLFWDGNKRTSFIGANHLMISRGAGILSVPVSQIANFNRALTAFYDSGNYETFAAFLYETSVHGLDYAPQA